LRRKLDRSEFVLDARGPSIHWPGLDEDIGIKLLLYFTPPST